MKEYKVVNVDYYTADTDLNDYSKEGWRPILMSMIKPYNYATSIIYYTLEREVPDPRPYR